MNRVDIGMRIKKIRLDQLKTQQDIADLCGFTKSHLSKIEKGKVMPSIGVLDKIAESLNTKVSHLLNEDKSHEFVHDHREQIEKNLIKTAKGYSMYPFAVNHDDKKIQPFYFVTRKDEHQLHTTNHDSDEFIYVLEGEMLMKIGSEEFHLKKGDGFYFNARYDHQTIPLTDEVKVINILT